MITICLYIPVCLSRCLLFLVGPYCMMCCDDWLQFGGKILTLIAVLSTSVLTVVTPVLTMLGDWIALLTVRVTMGVGQVPNLSINLIIEKTWYTII